MTGSAWIKPPRRAAWSARWRENDTMAGEQAVHGIWGFAKDFGLSRLKYLPTVSAAAEHALWQRILRSARVKILPGKAFACPEPGWFRLCHATDASTIATGINRLNRALETS